MAHGPPQHPQHLRLRRLASSPAPASHGNDIDIVSIFEAVGQFQAGKLDEAGVHKVECEACPGAGSCGGMYTANTMSSAIEAMGMSLPYDAS